MAKLKVGIIGVGGIAATHVPGWEASEEAEIAAGSDIREEALKTWGDQHGVSRLYSDSADLINDKDIDNRRRVYAQQLPRAVVHRRPAGRQARHLRETPGSFAG